MRQHQYNDMLLREMFDMALVSKYNAMNLLKYALHLNPIMFCAMHFDWGVSVNISCNIRMVLKAFSWPRFVQIYRDMFDVIHASSRDIGILNIHAFSRRYLTHWGRDKMAAVSQTTLSNASSWMKMLEFRLRFHWGLFLRVQLTIFQH